MNFIKSDILYRAPFGSGVIQPKPFINMIIDNNATVIITASNNPYGATYATPAEKETVLMIDNALDSLHVLHLEHLIISGSNYGGVLKPSYNVMQRPAVAEFIEGKRAHDELLME